MLIEQAPELDRTFAALADPTRREILRVLARGEAPAGELAGRFPISAPAVSRHLRVLEDAGLITRRVDGKHRRFRLEPGPLQNAQQWLDFYRRFWSESLQQLADHFDPPLQEHEGEHQGEQLGKPRNRRTNDHDKPHKRDRD